MKMCLRVLLPVLLLSFFFIINMFCIFCSAIDQDHVINTWSRVHSPLPTPLPVRRQVVFQGLVYCKACKDREVDGLQNITDALLEASSHDLDPVDHNIVEVLNGTDQDIVWNVAGYSADIDVEVDAKNDVDVDVDVDVDTTKDEDQLVDDFDPEDEDLLDQKMHVSDRATNHMTVRVKRTLAEFVTQYEKKVVSEKRLREKISQYLLRIAEESKENARLKQKITKFKDNVDQMLVKKGIEHHKVVDVLKKDLEVARASYDTVNIANIMNIKQLNLQVLGLEAKISKFEEEKAAWKQSKDLYDAKYLESEKLHEELKKMVDQVTRERNWLISEGFRFVVDKLHRGEEYLHPLGSMESALWSAAHHCGIIKGYDGCKGGMKVEHIDGYYLQSYDEYEKQLNNWQNISYPYLDLLSSSVGKSLEEIKALEPKGLTPQVNTDGAYGTVN